MNSIFLVLLVFLSACSTIDKFKGKNYAGADAGRIVIGIGETKEAYLSYTFFLRKRGEKEDPSLNLSYGKSVFVGRDKEDYANTREKGVVKSLRLAPGNYEIYQFSLYLNTGTSYTTIKSPEDFSIPFTIAPHKVTYVGNYQFNPNFSRFLGMNIPDGGKFVISDRETSDIALLKRKYPDEPVNQIIDATPKAKSIGNPAFIDANSGTK